MPSQHLQWIPIEEIITAYMDEAEISNHKYFKLWHLSFRGMTELGLDAFYAVKSLKLPINANLTVTLPPDYLNYVKVGVLNMQGEAIPMGFNSKLTSAFDLQSTRLQQTQDDTIPTNNCQNGVGWNNYWDGYAFSTFYGLPSGAPFIGNFNIDNANGVIVLNEGFSYPYIMLEYICSPQEGGEYYVPIQFKEAMIAYLAWKDIRSIPVKTHVQNNNVMGRRRDFYNERRLAIARYDPPKLGELYEWSLQNQRITVKA